MKIFQADTAKQFAVAVGNVNMFWFVVSDPPFKNIAAAPDFSHNYAIASLASSDQIVFPATIVATGRPLSFQPLNGLFLDLLADSSARKIHSCSGSKIVTSPSALTLKVPLGKFKSRAGLTVYFAIISASEILFG